MQRAIRSRLQAAALALLTGLAAGCQTYTRLSAGEYLIEAPYGGSVSYQSAVDNLEEKANRVCKQGYRKLHDFDTSTGSQRKLAWRVQCAGVTAKDLLRDQVGAPVADGD